MNLHKSPLSHCKHSFLHLSRQHHTVDERGTRKNHVSQNTKHPSWNDGLLQCLRFKPNSFLNWDWWTKIPFQIFIAHFSFFWDKRTFEIHWRKKRHIFGWKEKSTLTTTCDKRRKERYMIQLIWKEESQFTDNEMRHEAATVFSDREHSLRIRRKHLP